MREDLLSLKEASARFGVSSAVLTRAIRRGELLPAAVTSRGLVRLSSHDLERFVTERAGRQRAQGRRPSGFPPALHRASLLLTSELRLDRLLQRFADLARELVNAQYSALAVMNEDGRILQFFTSGITAKERAAIGNPPEGHGLLGLLFRDNRSVRIPDISQHPRSYGFPANHPPMRSLLGVPVVRRGKNLVNLYLTNKLGAAEFTAEDQRLVEVLAQYAAAAIENAALHKRVTERAREWQTLHKIARQIALQLDSRRILTTVVREARRFFNADAAFIALLEEDGHALRMTAHTGLKTRAMRSLRLHSNQGLGGAVLASRGPLIIEDYAHEPRLQEPLIQETTAEGLVSHMAVPLAARSKPLGVLYIACRDRRAFSNEEAQLLAAMGSLAAIAVVNAQLYERESYLARVAEEERQRLSTVLSNLPEGVLLIEPQERRIVMANQAAAELLLGTDDDLVGAVNPAGWSMRLPNGTVIPDDDLPGNRALREGTVHLGVEVVLRRRDGVEMPILVNSAPLRDAENQISGAVVVFQDITRLKEVESLKADFLSMVSHDLKGPLTTIKGLASGLLLDEGAHAQTEVLESLRSIDEETDRLSELVNNLLDMSRIEAHALPMEPELCHLADIAADIIRRIERSRLGSDHRIITDIPLDLPEVYADYDQIGRVLLNLLSNAVKYSPAGSAIYLEAHFDPSTSTITVQVRDSGIGIAKEEQDKIFDKFYRVLSQTGRGRAGAGLGLAICKAIIEAHNGSIWVESEPGKGSSFFFTLPVPA